MSGPTANSPPTTSARWSNSTATAASCWGLPPEELLPGSAQEIVDLFNARAATLRYGYDDDCRKLVSSTMDAYLRPSESPPFDRAADAVEKSYSKLAFAAAFCEGNLKKPPRWASTCRSPTSLAQRRQYRC